MLLETWNKNWSDRLNPVLVKEIRQYFHNKILLALMGLLLGGQLISLLVVTYCMEKSNSLLSPCGTELFMVLIFGVALCAYLVCGVGSMQRFCVERANPELDFTRITALTPFRIICGKLAGAFIIACFLYALALPFIVISYFLRGIEMRQILLITLCAFPILMLAVQEGLLLGSAGKKGISVLYIFGTLPFLQGIFGLIVLSRTPGGVFFFGPGNALRMFAFSMTVLLLQLGFLLELTVSAISHVSANRALPIRLYLLGTVILVPSALFLHHAFIQHPDLFKHTSGVLFSVGLIAGCFIASLAAWERTDPGKRVLRTVPRNFPGRCLCFLLYSGSRGGLTLAWLLVPVTGGAGFLYSSMNIKSGTDIIIGLDILFYSIFYAEAALLLRKFQPKYSGWICWACVLGICFIAPLLLQVLEGKNYSRAIYFATPFCLAEDNKYLYLAAPAMALLGLFLLAGSIFRQFRNFRKPQEEQK